MHGTFFLDFPGFPGFPELVGTLNISFPTITFNSLKTRIILFFSFPPWPIEQIEICILPNRGHENKTKILFLRLSTFGVGIEPVKQNILA